MQFPQHTRSRTEREDVVEVEPSHSVASQQTVQQPSPAAALPAATPSTPVARKRQRAEPAEPRIVRFVVRKFRPSDLKDIKNAEKRLARPQTQEALQHKKIIYVHRRLKAYKGARKEPSARVREVRGWKEIPECEPEILPDRNPVRFLFSALRALGGLLAPRRGTRWLKLARPCRRPPAAGSQRNWRARQSCLRCQRLGSQAANALGNLASQGWDIMATRCGWWTLAAAREYRMARESFEYRLQELQWVDNMSRTVAAARAELTSLPQGQSSLAGLVDRMRQEQLGGPAVTEDQVECLAGFWLSSAERLAALMGLGRTSLREFLSGVYRTGQALLGTAVATSVSSRLVAAPAAPREPSAFAPPTGPDSPSALLGTPEETTPPPPLPDLRAEEFHLPESSVTARDPPQQLGMDGLLNGSVGRSSADDDSAATVDKKKGSSAELSGTEQPAPKRSRTPRR
ncbi:hypothetical protein Emag_002010 [Eimeria magna]